MKFKLLLIFILCSLNTFSQITSFYVAPKLTDISYAASQDNHLVVRNITVNNNKLFLFIGGTWSNTSSYSTISKFVGRLGYDVINLSYPNTIPANYFKNSTDTNVFYKFREHICYGTNLTVMSVDSLNSIHGRTLKLLSYLDSTYPSQNWSQYLSSSSQLNWNKIVVGGHSQGSGHACYFGKKETPERVLMFSGPNDYSDHYSRPALWFGKPGLTSLSKQFSFLHLYDQVVDYSKQLDILDSLGLYPLYDTTFVSNKNIPFDNSRCLYLSDTSGLISPHGKTVSAFGNNDSVLVYMLSDNTSSGTKELEKKNTIHIYPNPSNGKFHINMSSNGINKNYTLRNINGQILIKGKTNSDTNLQIDISHYPLGIYIFTLDIYSYKLVKE